MHFVIGRSKITLPQFIRRPFQGYYNPVGFRYRIIFAVSKRSVDHVSEKVFPLKRPVTLPFLHEILLVHITGGHLHRYHSVARHRAMAFLSGVLVSMLFSV